MDTFISDKPLVINWMISGDCNMNCKFCYSHFDTYKMPRKDKFFILNQVINHKIPKLTLTGGEPLMDKDIIEIIKTASTQNVFTSLHTNGLLLNENSINRIKNYIGRISLPLDGSSNEMNFKMRGHRNYYSRIIGITEILKSEGISYSIKTVASRKNIQDLENMADLIMELNPVVWLITEFKPLRRGANNRNKFQLHHGEFEKLKVKLESLPLNINLLSNNSLSIHPHFFIDPKGNVFTNGPESDFHIGDMFTLSIPELWQKIIEINKITKEYYDHSRISVNASHKGR